MSPVPFKITSRYEIKGRIGRGGMGTLYLARDTNPKTERLVAIKLLNADLDSADLRARFDRESQALADLNHSNIVTILDSGEFEGSAFIVMEYVRGETLAEKIKRRAPLSLATKVRLMEELCNGLAQAHQVGIIHRDIKPANVMVNLEGHLKILDFGIARVAEGGFTRAGVQLTQVNMRIGTPGYMSPEQIEGAEIDHRSDLFAVGAVCYELISYREAFPGGTTRQIENRVLHDEPAPLATSLAGLDPELERIIRVALEKDADRRYQDALAFERALELVRLRLPRDEDEPGRRLPPTPPPRGSLERKSRHARAEAAYQRALASDNEGAPEFARRSAMEALAEDPGHQGARMLLAKLNALSDVEPWLRLLTEIAQPPTALTQAATVVAEPPTVIVETSTVRSTGGRWAAGMRRPSGRVIAIAALMTIVGAAAFAAIRFQYWPFRQSNVLLTVSRPTGGTISIPGVGIRCGTSGRDCSTTFRIGEVVEVQVKADPEFVFAGFTGDCAPGGRTAMTMARTCGARFDPIPDATQGPDGRVQLLTIIRPTGGSLLSDEGLKCGAAGGDCSLSRPEGTQVVLRPQPERGYVFDAFTGDCAPNGTTTMAGPRTCGAAFRRETAAPGSERPARAQRLTIEKPAGGTLVSAAGIMCGTAGSRCSVEVPEGLQVSLIPQPDSGYRFNGFTGDCASGGTTTMTGRRACGGSFSPAGPSPTPEQPLTITRPAGGTITNGAGINCGTQGTACSGLLATGAQVQLQAHADEGFTFRGFTDDCVANGVTTMTAPRTCGATFDRVPVGPRPPGNPRQGQMWTNPADDLVMAWVPPPATGTFMMGSPPGEAGRDPAKEGEGQFETKMAAGFWIDQTEVSRQAFTRFVQKAPEWQRGPLYQGDSNLPVVNVTWRAAKAYCEWAGNRLPSEAEWEYAARGNSTRRYSWGNDRFDDEYANRGERLLAVISKTPNRFYLYNMLGNAWEWTSSLYLPYPYGPASEDPKASGRRVVRGGAFGQNENFLRIASRVGADPGTMSDQGGFRCAR
jgi:serine/threonine protein kinase/formylglycine-generating enzyme required for sulfatase activity